MTLIGPRTAVVSVGLSCQTSHQLRRHAPMLRTLLDDDVQVARGPFDWLIAPMAASSAMIANREFFPRSIAELDWCRHPYWPRYDCFFWHYDYLFEHPGVFMAKFSAASSNMDLLDDLTRRIFIVSNCQNSLLHLASSVGGIETRFSDTGVDNLNAVIEARWGPSELYLVGYPELSDCVNESGFAAVTADASEWQGDDRQWEAILHSIATRTLPPRGH